LARIENSDHIEKYDLLVEFCKFYDSLQTNHLPYFEVFS